MSRSTRTRVLLICVIFLSEVNITWSLIPLLRQKVWSLENTKLSLIIADGADLALDHCQKQFIWDRWNCPQTAFSKRNFDSTNREIGFAHAILTAAMVYTIVDSCQTGRWDDAKAECLCSNETFKFLNDSRNPNRDNQERMVNWGKKTFCLKRNLDVAERFISEHFGSILAPMTGDLQSFIHQHNARLGRVAIEKTLKKHCHCPTGGLTCNVEMCFDELPDFEDVAKFLKDRYDKALHVDFDRKNADVYLGNSFRTSMLSELADLVSDDEMLYLVNSPNYCEPNETLGYKGTLGRQCSRSNHRGMTISEKKSCKNLCRTCGHRVKKRVTPRQWQCQCRFKWCCEVECETCSKNVEEYVCAARKSKSRKNSV